MPRLFRLPRRATIAYAHDIVMAAVAFVLAFLLRVGDDIAIYHEAGVLLPSTLAFTGIAAGVFLAVRLYRGVWRYASLDDVLAIVKAATLVVLIFVPAMFVLTRLELVPRSLPPIAWFVMIAMLVGPRVLYRVLKDGRFDRILARENGQRVPVLVAGAGDEAARFIAAMSGDKNASYRVVAVLDDKGGRIGRVIHGVPVMGHVDELEDVVARLDRRGDRPQRVVLAARRIDGPRVRGLLERCFALKLTLARAPAPTEFKTDVAPGTTSLEPRPIAIEDLLGRSQAVLDRQAMRGLVTGRRVMVTGAGGSIGSELVRQIARLAPAEIVLLENGELALYEIEHELARTLPELPRRALLCDVRDETRVDELFADVCPELVFHAAAFKHVPLVEANPIEGIRTNAAGTRIVADACRRHGIQAMVLISTDKAVNPTSMMGATKRLAETWCQALDNAAQPGETRFVTVRFGNVLGSTGSVVPLFQRQLATGGPLTVTHPDVVRYFMTVGEAVELVLQAAALRMVEPRTGHIYVLDMGEPVRIVDLARQMIRLAGLEPDRDIQITFTGLRPGERLSEELFHARETLQPSGHGSILIASPRAADSELLRRSLTELEAAVGRQDVERAVALVRQLVPEYRPAAIPAGPAAAIATGAS